MGSAQQRLATALQLDKAATQQFMREVFKLARDFGGVTLSEITTAAEAYVQRNGRPPTSDELIDHICEDAMDRMLERVEARKTKGVGERPVAGQEAVPDFNPNIFNDFFGQVLGCPRAGSVKSGTPGAVTTPATATADSRVHDRPPPWKLRLARVLELDISATDAFVERVFKLRHRSEHFSLADFLPVVEDMKRQEQVVTAESLYVRLRLLSDQRKKGFAHSEQEPGVRKVRNHVSVWEIRN